MVIFFLSVGVGALPAWADTRDSGTPTNQPSVKKGTAVPARAVNRAPATSRAGTGVTGARAAASRTPASAAGKSAQKVSTPTTVKNASPVGASRSPASATLHSGSESEQVLKVSGQSRNLSMMLTIKSEKDKIKFGEIRENYKNEVKKTNY